ncbi:MAG: hypothetical protein AMJ41_01085 [candidate division Zixibacteria bacterium DG_27]|nr:MAG: hypothetical protein AMJ41_01085 [candidate division Zixibacteria bacterium DG_27]
MKKSNAKQVLLETLKKQYRIESIRGSDVVALNSKAILYIRYSKNVGITKNLIGKFWFGITESEYEKYCTQNLFIVCACAFAPEEIDYLVFPSQKFDQIKKDIVLRSGQWKFNLLKTNEERWFLQISNKGKYEVTQFLNYFDFSPSEFRKTYWPSLGELQPKVSKEEVVPVSDRPIPLEDELFITAKDSGNPKNFELALEKFFAEMGFRCKRIGRAGETDVLVLEPVRFIVDGKSTKRDVKSAINFTRIKRHMKEHKAEFMVIVSVGFDPAVGKDGEMEGATLIDVQTLISLLKSHKEYILSPFDYVEILRQPGIITSEKLSTLQETIQYQRDLVAKPLILIQNLDFTPRNVDEIKGRTDLYCEQNRVANIERVEMESLLVFLAHDLLGIVERKDNKYSLRFTPQSSKEKLRNTIRILCATQLDERNDNGRS